MLCGSFLSSLSNSISANSDRTVSELNKQVPFREFCSKRVFTSYCCLLQHCCNSQYRKYITQSDLQCAQLPAEKPFYGELAL